MADDRRPRPAVDGTEGKGQIPPDTSSVLHTVSSAPDAQTFRPTGPRADFSHALSAAVRRVEHESDGSFPTHFWTGRKGVFRCRVEAQEWPESGGGPRHIPQKRAASSRHATPSAIRSAPMPDDNDLNTLVWVRDVIHHAVVAHAHAPESLLTA